MFRAFSRGVSGSTLSYPTLPLKPLTLKHQAMLPETPATTPAAVSSSTLISWPERSTWSH